MVTCPHCDSSIDIDEQDLDEGETLSCDECGATLTVTSLDPLELEAAEEEEEDDEDDDEFDYDEEDDEDEDEEEEEEEEDWK